MAILLSIETDLIGDAAASLALAHMALTHRHGAAFRDLERRIGALAEGEAPIGDIDLKSLGGGRMVATAPTAMLALLAEAKALGVI